jgi:DNA-binding CsgD family transcriptional regulator
MAGRQAPELFRRSRTMLELERAAPGPSIGPAEIVRRQVVGLDAFLRGDRVGASEGSRWVAERLADQGAGGELPPLLAIGPAFVLSGLGEWEAAEAVITAALERARPRGSPLETAECLHERIWHRWRRGDVVGGLADIETVLELTAGAWDPAKVPMRVAEAHLLLERDRPEDAAAALALPPELERVLPGTWGWPWLAIGRAVVALAAGDHETALQQALEGGERLRQIEATSPEFAPWRSLAAIAAARGGDLERGRELAANELTLGEEIGAPRARGTALLALAEIARGTEPVETLRAAISALDEARADLLRARARLELGMALRRARHPSDARAPLREALDLAQRIGATALAERALAELRAAGARPRRHRASGAEALTPREREIAALAAEGLGNVEIAERLFITRKTVEGHLRTVFRKLEIASRDEITEGLSP